MERGGACFSPRPRQRACQDPLTWQGGDALSDISKLYRRLQSSISLLLMHIAITCEQYSHQILHVEFAGRHDNLRLLDGLSGLYFVEDLAILSIGVVGRIVTLCKLQIDDSLCCCFVAV